MAPAETVWSKKPSGEKVLAPNSCHFVQYLLNTAKEIDVLGFLSFCPFFFFEMVFWTEHMLSNVLFLCFLLLIHIFIKVFTKSVLSNLGDSVIL